MPARGEALPRREQSGRSDLALILMLTVSVGYLVVFVGYPVLYNFVLSVQDVQLMNLGTMDRPFVGLAHYREIASDGLFSKVVRITVLFLAGNVAFQFLLGLAVALLFQRSFPGSGWLRGLVLAGWILPPMVVGALWKWMFATEYGVVNFVAGALGLSEGVYWLSDPGTALLSVTIANIWFGLPFNMILLSAGLSAIPDDLYEAAELDGAGPLARLWFVTLPLLKATMLAVVCLSTIYTMRAFDLIWAMTRGGPVDNTTTLPLWSYKLSFERFDFGPGAAVASLSLVFVTLVALLYVRAVRSEHRG